MIELRHNGQLLHLRDTLFWDIDPSKLDVQKSIKLIIERILTRGNMEEFKQMNLFYSINEIRNTLVKIGYMDDKTMHFVSRYFSIPKNEFICYKKRQ